MKFILTLWNELKAGATSSDEDAGSEKVEDCGTDAPANQYVFERIRSAKKKLSRAAKRKTISNKFGSDQTYPTANNDDNFSSYDNGFDDIVDKQTATTASTHLNIHFMWIFLRDLLTSLVNTNDNDSNDNTDNNFELNASSNECDYLDDSNYFTIIDGDLSEDEYSEKHKLLRQKLLGNCSFFNQHQPTKIIWINCPQN